LDDLIKNHQESIILLDTEIKKRIDDLKNKNPTPERQVLKTP